MDNIWLIQKSFGLLRGDEKASDKIICGDAPCLEHLGIPCVLLSVDMQVMNNNGIDKEGDKGGLTLEQFTDIVLAQVRTRQTNICSKGNKKKEEKNRRYD